MLDKPKMPRRDKELLGKVVMRIKELRAQYGHSQADLNAATDVDVANIETGSNFPNLYDITLDEFFAPLNYPPKTGKVIVRKLEKK